MTDSDILFFGVESNYYSLKEIIHLSTLSDNDEFVSLFFLTCHFDGQI